MLDGKRMRAVCSRFGITSDPKCVRVSQNAVYEVEGDGGDRSILRVSSGRGRSLEQIEAELDWVADLAARGIDVCLPRPSLGGRRCERVVCGDAEFLAVRFDRAPGRKVVRADVDEALYASLGTLVAKLHAASFDDDSPQPRRPVWYESRLLTTYFHRHARGQPRAFRAAVERLVDELKAVPAVLRLVHADVSFGNTFLDGSRLWIFDFDNCELGSVEHDLAVVLYDGVLCHFLNRVPADRLAELTRLHWGAFLAGYRSVRDCELDLDALRKHLILREAVIYVHYLRTLDPSAMTDAWRAGLDRMRQNVELGRAEVEVDERWQA